MSTRGTISRPGCVGAPALGTALGLQLPLGAVAECFRFTVRRRSRQPTPGRINGSGLRRGGTPRRTGRRHLQIRRALIIADGRPITTHEMFAAVHPEIDLSETRPEWRWAKVRLSASRYAERILEPRARPLLWRAKPGFDGR